MAVAEENGQIQIHTENIFPIIVIIQATKSFEGAWHLLTHQQRRMASIAGDCSEGDEGVIRSELTAQIRPHNQ